MTHFEQIPSQWVNGSPPPALLGFIIGTALSVLLWAFVGWGAWAIFTF